MRQVTGEALVSIFVIRITIGMLLSLYAANWIERQGRAPVFAEMTAIQVVSVLFAIPLYFRGHSLRAFTSRYGPMKRFLRYVTNLGLGTKATRLITAVYFSSISCPPLMSFPSASMLQMSRR